MLMGKAKAAGAAVGGTVPGLTSDERQPEMVNMIEEKESICTSLDEEKALTAERISQAIRDLPDYTKIDDTGFSRDLWHAFRDDAKRIWRQRHAPKGDPQPGS
jgi:hypothetical protein